MPPDPFNDGEQFAVVRARINEGWADLGDLENLAYGADLVITLSHGVTLSDALHSELHRQRIVCLRHATDRTQPVELIVPDGLTRSVRLMRASDQTGGCRLVRAQGGTATLNGGMAVELDVDRAILEVEAPNVYRISAIPDSADLMLRATYDPEGIANNAFHMDYMAEGTNAKVMTAAERARIEAGYIVAGGSVTMAGQETLVAIPEQPDTDYFIQLSRNVSDPIFWDSPATDSFKIRSSNPSSTAVVHWQVTRAKERGAALHYVAQLVRFNGSTRLVRSGELTGAIDTRYVRGGFWFRRNGGFAVAQRIFGNSSSRFRINFNTFDRIEILCQNNSGDPVVQFRSKQIQDSEIHHFAFGVRTDAADIRMWLDNEPALEIIEDPLVNQVIDFATGDWGIGARTQGDTWLNADIGELFMQSGPSVASAPMDETALRSLINADGTPVAMATTAAQLGAGQLAMSGPAATWHQNPSPAATGGAFTVAAGALTNAPGLVYLR